MSIWQAVLLGFVQGITEFLPVSSSGHLVLFQHFLGFEEPQLLFDVFVHFATLFAVAIFFFQTLLKLRFSQWKVIAIGTLPAVVLGLLFKDFFESLFAAEALVAGALLVTGVVNIISEKLLQQQKSEQDSTSEEAVDVEKQIATLTPLQAILIGTFQAVAIIPGISRSGSTLLGGLLQKLDRRTAFTFSFLLSLPAVAGATLLQILDVLEVGSLTVPIHILLSGGIAAFVSGYLSLWIFKKIVASARLQFFGYYCFIAGGGSLLLFLLS